MSQNGQDLVFGKERRAIVELRDTDYEKVAAAFGGFGIRVTKLEEIEPAMAAALACGKPACVNVTIDGSIINPVTMRMIGITPPSKGTALAKNAVVMPYYDNVSEPQS